MFNKKVILGVFIFFIIIMLGFIKINTVNTKALSPLGNSDDNYELVKDEFGEEFQEFIKDNAEVKIYESNSNNNNPTIKIGSKEFIVDLNNKVTKQIYNLGGYIYNGFNNIINKFDKKSDNNDESSNTKENNTSDGNKKVENIIDNYLDSINNNEEKSTTESNNEESGDIKSNTNQSNTNKDLDNIINNYLDSVDN